MRLEKIKYSFYRCNSECYDYNYPFIYLFIQVFKKIIIFLIELNRLFFQS